jgi:hypothetical protein
VLTAPGFGIITRRTGASRYGFSVSSFRKLASPVEGVTFVVIEKESLEAPGDPALARAKS